MYPRSKWSFVKFEKSHNRNKKYNAVLQNKKDKDRFVRVPFGAIRSDGVPYEQFKDSALGLYSDYDHGDKERRERWLARHGKYDKKYFSPLYFSTEFLW